MKKLELSKEELRLIAKALDYTGNQYYEVVKQLVSIDRSNKNRSTIERAEECHILSEKIKNQLKE